MSDRRYAPASDVRQWALEHDVYARMVKPGNGRLSATIIEAFNHHHPERPYIDGVNAATRDRLIRARRALAGEP